MCSASILAGTRASPRRPSRRASRPSKHPPRPRPQSALPGAPRREVRVGVDQADQRPHVLHDAAPQAEPIAGEGVAGVSTGATLGDSASAVTRAYQPGWKRCTYADGRNPETIELMSG